MNAAVVFFVIGMGAAAVLVANRFVTRGRRPGAHERDGGAAYGHGGDHRSHGREDVGPGHADAAGGADGGGDGGGD